MLQTKFIILQVLGVCCGDWISEWMAPVQDEFGTVKDINARMNYDADLKMYEDQELKIPNQEFSKAPKAVNENESAVPEPTNNVSSPTLQAKLEATLERAHALAATLQKQIALISNREAALKETIATGRSGVSVVTVHTLARAPRSYVVRDGAWTACRGLLQPADPYGARPKCIGVETKSQPDPCVFNSIIKYETIPARRRAEYAEDDFLCLKSGFNTMMEHYQSVPRAVVNDTCRNGVVRSLEDNIAECGLRVFSKYVYFPSATAQVPLEYCEPAAPGAPTACHLVAAWHLSNVTIQKFEFLTDEPAFEDFFMKNK